MLNDLQRISVKCRNMSVAAIVCVVAIHSHALVTQTASPHWMWVLCDIVFGKLTCWAVPFFFAVSGYWFGVKECVSEGSFEVACFYRKKFKTLCVPYAFFVLFGLVASIPLAYMAGTKNGDGTLAHIDLSWDILGVTKLLPTGNGPMWYLRTLIFLFILAPVWRFVALRFKWLLLPMAGMALISPPIVISGVVPFRVGQSSFFFLGLFLSQCKSVTIRRSLWAVGGLALVACGLIWSDLLLGKYGLAVSGVLPYIMLGFVWALYDVVAPPSFAKVSRLSSYVFWIFGVHIIFLNWMLPPLRSFVRSQIMLLIMTPAAALGAVLLSVAFAMLTEKTSKTLYNTIVGGR